MDSLIEPLTVAVLNTPAASGLPQRLAVRCAGSSARAPAGSWWRGTGLSADLVEPAVATLAGRGVPRSRRASACARFSPSTGASSA